MASPLSFRSLSCNSLKTLNEGLSTPTHTQKKGVGGGEGGGGAREEGGVLGRRGNTTPVGHSGRGEIRRESGEKGKPQLSKSAGRGGSGEGVGGWGQSREEGGGEVPLAEAET